MTDQDPSAYDDETAPPTPTIDLRGSHFGTGAVNPPAGADTPPTGPTTVTNMFFGPVIVDRVPGDQEPEDQ